VDDFRLFGASGARKLAELSKPHSCTRPSTELALAPPVRIYSACERLTCAPVSLRERWGVRKAEKETPESVQQQPCDMAACVAALCPLSYSTTRVVEIRCALPAPCSAYIHSLPIHWPAAATLTPVASSVCGALDGGGEAGSGAGHSDRRLGLLYNAILCGALRHTCAAGQPHPKTLTGVGLT